MLAKFLEKIVDLGNKSKEPIEINERIYTASPKFAVN